MLSPARYTIWFFVALFEFVFCFTPIHSESESYQDSNSYSPHESLKSLIWILLTVETQCFSLMGVNEHKFMDVPLKTISGIFSPSLSLLTQLDIRTSYNMTLHFPPSGPSLFPVYLTCFLSFGSCSERRALCFTISLTDFATELTLYSNSKTILYSKELTKLASFTQGCITVFFSQWSDDTFQLGCRELKRISLSLNNKKNMDNPWVLIFLEPTS